MGGYHLLSLMEVQRQGTHPNPIYAYASSYVWPFFAGDIVALYHCTSSPSCHINFSLFHFKLKMKSLAVLALYVVSLRFLECYVAADFFEPQADSGEQEYTGRYNHFPSDREDNDEDDGIVENIEEGFEMPLQDFENSKEFPSQNFRLRDRDEGKEVFENSRAFPEMDSQTPEKETMRELLEEPRNLHEDHVRSYGQAYIQFVKVKAKTGYDDPLRYGEGQRSSYGANPQLLIVLKNGVEYRAELKYDKYRGYQYSIELNAKTDFTPQLSCTRGDIDKVYLEARGGDGWYVESIDTYTAGSNRIYTELTTDPGFSMWVDNDEEHLYPYNAKKLLLTYAVAGSCITYVRVNAATGTMNGADSSYSYSKHQSHWVVLTLSNNQKFQAQLEGPMRKGESYVRDLNFVNRFGTTQCVSLSSVREIHLKSTSNDNWYISSIRTSAKTGVEQYMDLTSDPNLNKWLGGYHSNEIKLNWVHQETLNCEYGNPTCECMEHAQVCKFNLEIDEIRTFTSYQKLSVDEPTGVAMRGSQGVIYYFGDDGSPTPLQDGRTCSTQDNAKCTNPQFVDGKTYRLAIAVNGLIPGPTLIVHEGQMVEVHVHNNLTTEGISIHWHGMHQRGTPWMDGVGQVTQCQIGPSSTFTYVYKAEPAGTFWYHSHSGAQRTDGFFGGLVVKESRDKMTQIRNKLNRHRAFEDLPDQHTLTLLDWQHEASLDLFTQIHASLGFYPGKPLGEVPTKDDLQRRYESTRSYEEGEVGPVPYYSGIINGKGRHDDVPYIKTRLSIFTVQAGKTYRFRLIGAQNLYAYKFSVDGHKLTVVGTDGYWIQPVENVDYIIIHTGERFDFLLEATNTIKDYWMRAETLEIDRSSNGPPYKSLGHVAEAILHYQRNGDSPDSNVNVPSTRYEDIKQRSPRRHCSHYDPCKAINCPFKNFHRLYHITCVNIQELRLLEPTPHAELPNANPKTHWQCPKCRHFINFNFEGDSQTSAVNGRNFILPSFPPQTQNEEFQKKDNICDLNAKCNPSTPECSCVQVITIPHGETIQLVFSAIGAYHNAHPIHLHGHTFHVVHVGYPEYDSTTGFITKHNSDIYCDDVNCKKENCVKERCTRPRWAQDNKRFSIDSHTIRKDTVMLPAGGYVVINFLSDNPGYWFLHCHIEVHQLEGMAMIVNEAPEVQSQLQPPQELNKCGDVEISVQTYQKYQSNFQRMHA